MSETKTPRTDAVALDDIIVKQSRLLGADRYAELLDHARQLETELAAEQQARVAAEIALRAWHNVFGTTQLSHAHAGLEAATERAERAEARALELEKDAERHQARRREVYLTRMRLQIYGPRITWEDFCLEYDAACDREAEQQAAIDAAQRKEGV